MAEPTLASATDASTFERGSNSKEPQLNHGTATKSFIESKSLDGSVSLDNSLEGISSESGEDREGRNLKQFDSIDSGISLLVSRDSKEGGVKSNRNKFGLPVTCMTTEHISAGERRDSTQGAESSAVSPEDRDEVETENTDLNQPSRIVRDTTEYGMYNELLHTMPSDLSAQTNELHDSYLAIVQPEKSSSSSSDDDTLYSVASEGSDAEQNWFQSIFCFFDEETSREKKVQKRAEREKLKSMDARQHQKMQLRKKMAEMSPHQARAFRKKIAHGKNLKHPAKEEIGRTKSSKKRQSKSRSFSGKHRSSSFKLKSSSSQDVDEDISITGQDSPDMEFGISLDDGQLNQKASIPAARPRATPVRPSTAAAVRPSDPGVKLSAHKMRPNTAFAMSKNSLGATTSTAFTMSNQHQVEVRESVVDQLLKEDDAAAKKLSKKKWKKLFR